MSSSFKGTFSLNAHIFERWQDESNFFSDMQDVADILSSRSELKISVDSGRLKVAHEKWVSAADAWLSRLLPAGTKRLSHLKMCAILLAVICDERPFDILGQTKIVAPSYQDAGPSPDDIPNRMDDDDRRKLSDGGSHYIGWSLIYHICRHFESLRTDRLDKFVERITEEFELDAVSALISGRVSAQALHLILKALFLRD